MAAASNFLEDSIANSILRGIAFPTISGVYVALHTADPTDTGSNEATTGSWPAYVRKDSTNAGAATLANSWSAPANGICKNELQLIYPVYDGVASMTVTHFSLWDAATGGNMIVHSAMTTNRTVQNGDVFVIDVQKLTVQVL